MGKFILTTSQFAIGNYCANCVVCVCLQEQVLDPKTRLMLYKLVNGEILEAVNGCISTGKEACVFHANGGRFVNLVLINRNNQWLGSAG